jgi:hypothetical protein
MRISKGLMLTFLFWNIIANILSFYLILVYFFQMNYVLTATEVVKRNFLS